MITRSPVPDQVTRLLQLPRAITSHRHGRGAFRVRWVPGRPWIAHYQNGPFIARDGDHVVMVVSTTTEANIWADRVLREILIHGGRQRGFGLCHCAMVTGDSGGVLITGTSGAGKTNLALKLGRFAGVQVVTVDRGIIGVHRGRLAVGTLPFGLSIHRGTLTDLGCFDSTLGKRYPASNHKHYLDVAAAQRYCGIIPTAWADVTAVVRLVPGGDTAWWQ